MFYILKKKKSDGSLNCIALFNIYDTKLFTSISIQFEGTCKPLTWQMLKESLHFFFPGICISLKQRFLIASSAPAVKLNFCYLRTNYKLDCSTIYKSKRQFLLQKELTLKKAYCLRMQEKPVLILLWGCSKCKDMQNFQQPQSAFWMVLVHKETL